LILNDAEIAALAIPKIGFNLFFHQSWGSRCIHFINLYEDVFNVMIKK